MMAGGEKKGSFLARLLGRSAPLEETLRDPQPVPEPEASSFSPSASFPDSFEEKPVAQGSAIIVLGAETSGPLPEETATPLSWWQRLNHGLRRSSQALGHGVADIFSRGKLDAERLEALEDVLIQADLGVAATTRLLAKLEKGRFERDITADDVRRLLVQEIETVLAPVAVPLAIDGNHKPFTILMVGVNGAGKTTTIGKLAAEAKAKGLSVMLAAGDTFRAAAIEQLTIWGERNGVPVLAREQGSDAAGLAFDALQHAKAQNHDLLLIDTAGRLQNKTGLMAELEKIIRVLKKIDSTAPHAVLLVLDATVGQNALSQVELFQRAAGVTGLIMTKLDGTARGGILVALAEKFALPIHFLGVGENLNDLKAFAPNDFARALVGLDQDTITS
jgi:fused signal recognition particle receptor